MNTSAGGASAKHSGFSAHAAQRNSAAASATALQACRSVRRPEGSSRARVRGLRASSSRSAMRLNPSATNRAAVKASTTRPSVRQVSVVSRDATSNPSSANGRANTVCASLTKLTKRMRRLSPPNVCPSRTSELNPQLLPHRVHAPLGLDVHHDPVRPVAREAFFLPLARRVDPHFRPEGEPPTRVIEHVDRARGEAYVALGVDMVQRDPPRLMRILYVHVLVEHDDHLGQRHQPLAPQAVHHLVRLPGVLLVDAH